MRRRCAAEWPWQEICLQHWGGDIRHYPLLRDLGCWNNWILEDIFSGPILGANLLLNLMAPGAFDFERTNGMFLEASLDASRRFEILDKVKLCMKNSTALGPLHKGPSKTATASCISSDINSAALISVAAKSLILCLKWRDKG